MGTDKKGGDSISQSERFKQTARELGVELDEEKLREVLRKIAPRRKEGEESPTQKDD